MIEHLDSPAPQDGEPVGAIDLARVYASCLELRRLLARILQSVDVHYDTLVAGRFRLERAAHFLESARDGVWNAASWLPDTDKAGLPLDGKPDAL